jgi:hypothetical protein
MREEGMAKDGSALAQEASEGYWDNGRDAATRGATTGAAAVGEDEGHLEGHTTDILALQRLPIARADVAFVVADVGR